MRRSGMMAALICLLLLAGCAKTGEPRPPRLLVPRPASGLSLRQLANRVELIIPLPTENTDGSPVSTLAEVEVFRMARRQADVAAPSSEEDFLARSARIMALPAPALADRARDGVVRLQDDPPGAGSPEGGGYYYAVRFINRRYQTAGLSNFAYIAPIAIPEAPEGLDFRIGPDRIVLTWDRPARNSDGSEPARVAGFNVYRSENPEEFPEAPLNDQPLVDPTFADRAFRFGATYHYAVTVVGSVRDPEAESARSDPVKIVALDTFAPGPPGELDAVVTTGTVTLLWIAPPDPDLAGFRVYRAEEPAETRSLLGGGIIRVPSYRDPDIRPGARYRYEIVAVDASGNESRAAVVRVEVP